VRAYESSAVIYTKNVQVKIYHNAIAVVRPEKFLHTINSFLDIYPLDENGLVTLYKSVNPETLCDFRTGEIRYEGEVICPDFDPDPARHCGGGLHLSPRPEMALAYNQGKLLLCKARPEDVVVYAEDINKVRCKRVEVIKEL
jgi:hypothetical protein